MEKKTVNTETVPSSEFTSTDFVLRLSKPMHPRIKTQNEVGWLTFLSQNSKLKVPKVLFWSDFTEELGYEYTVIEKLSGEALCNIWETIDPQCIVQEVADIILELRALTKKLEYHWFGGMTANGKAGAFIEVTSYTEEHINRYWSSSDYSDESYETLNLTSSFSSWDEYLKARIKRDIHVIGTHQSCITLRTSFLFRLRKLLTRSNIMQKDIQSYIAHRDLHFANLLWSAETNSISGVFDWELAGLYPLSDWNPGNTCWTVIESNKPESSSQEKLFEMLEEELSKRHAIVVENVESEEYQYRKIVSLTYWIVLRFVEGRKDDERVKEWIEQWEDYMKKLGI
ncbi:unnamed protein product [Adineta steineri]|uniref:Aminoglycoside phosphotransferase domain-containing protein n=1 Tax=Adineta steineri TaxID=433720 RepID=A0A813MWE9_9BILA|nr:unnamed protein product [Adineta steineri]CAF4020501.1 unnamed protein product [Adineta steineri]